MAGNIMIELTDKQTKRLGKASSRLGITRAELVGQRAIIEYVQVMADKQRDYLAQLKAGEVSEQKVLDEYQILMAVLDMCLDGCTKQIDKTSVVIKDAEAVIDKI